MSSCQSTLPLHGSALPHWKLFCPPSASQSYNQCNVCSCWTKWTEEYLKAYQWHFITQNSFCLCYAHLSLWLHIWHGWMVILPEENWKRLCAALQYVLPSSLWMFLWSREAAKQRYRGNCFPVMGWIDIRFCRVAVYFSCLPSLPNKNHGWLTCINWCLNEYSAQPVTLKVYKSFQIATELSIQNERLISPHLKHSSMGIPYCYASVLLRLIEERRTHPAGLTGRILSVRPICNTTIL